MFYILVFPDLTGPYSRFKLSRHMFRRSFLVNINRNLLDTFLKVPVISYCIIIKFKSFYPS